MHILKKQTLEQFWRMSGNEDSMIPLRTWHRRMEKGHFQTYRQITEAFGGSDFIGNNRVVFNIKGNDYRLIVEFHLPTQVGYIVFLGTHAEYDKIDARVVDLNYP